MDALFEGETFDAEIQPESVRNIVARYGDTRGYFPEKLAGLKCRPRAPGERRGPLPP